MRLLVLLVLVKGDEVDDTYSMAVVVVVVVFVDIVDDDGADFFSKGQYC